MRIYKQAFGTVNAETFGSGSVRKSILEVNGLRVSSSVGLERRLAKAKVAGSSPV